ncbi:tetratricopeptide repeat protein [Saccharopolyspora sp. NPDC050642]|uniref:tetratricopeptide repeat protein n=1 Tax=Saccharopolyspora sp. NPDC050642 TaxID=3157099 RepID=UPI0033C696FD
MDFKIFGQVRLRLAGTWQDDWQATKIRGLLGVLLTRPGKTIPISLVVDWLWGREADPARHAKTLQTYVTRLRGVLNTMESSATVKNVNAGYRLNIDRERVDYHYVRDLLVDAQRAARHGDHELVCELLPEALELSAEPPLVDLDTDLADAFRRQALATLVMPAHYTLMESQLALGNPEQVLATTEELQPEHELNVTLAKKRIQALRAADRDYEATEYFFHQRRLLQSHDLVEEADELRTFFDQIRLPVPSPRRGGEDVAPQSSGPPRKLPRDLRDFGGRADLVDVLDEYTENGTGAGLLVLVGTAGIGKTALSVHWAHHARQQFAGGDFYLDMNGFSLHPPLSSADLVRALLSSFGVSADLLGDTRDQWAQLSTFMSDRHMLLLLDNVADVGQIEPLLDVAHEAVILVTSRHHLDRLLLHHGAQEIHVPLLDEATGTRWLRETIGVRCDREPDAVQELVGLCSGIPLALRIVGHYARERREVSLSDIAGFLREEHRILKVGDSPNGDHTSVRASFALSYRTLPGLARRMFRLLGLHPVAQTGLETAAALAGSTPQQAREDLDVLVHSHLIEQKAEHYELHDLIHEFAAERAEEDEDPVDRAEALVRMLDWYLHTAGNAEAKLFPYRPGVPMLPLDDQVTPKEFEDDQDAMRWFLQERRALLAMVRVAADHGQDRYTWRLANTINEPLKRLGRYQEALDSLGLALTATRALGEREGECICLNNIGYICLSIREFNRAYDHFSESYRICRSLGLVLGSSVALHNMACQWFRINDWDASERLFTDALEVQLLHGFEFARAGTLRRFGELRHKQADYAEASVLYHESLALHRKVGNAHGAGEVLGQLSQLHLDRGDLQVAIDFGEQALVCHRRSSDLVSLAVTICVLGTAHFRRGQVAEAVEYARESVRICWRTNDVETEARALELLAAALFSAGSRDASVEGWERASDLYRSCGNDGWVAIQERLAELGHR